MRVDQELFGDPLPTYLTRFVGRDQELSKLTALVDSARLVTICGIGGSGKTRLAVEFARRLGIDPARGGFRNGVAWVPLVDVAEPEDLPPAVAAALGLREAAGGQPTVAVRQSLADQHLLLVLDNCEQVAPGCADLAGALLPVCPHVSVLATSRRALDCEVEVVFDLPALGMGTIGQGDAVAMFIDRAMITSPSYALTEANSEAVREICVRLDGLPLAIELVASWIRVLSPRDLLTTLREGATVLSSDIAQVDERHRSIHSVLDSTWKWLAAEDQRLLRSLGVFRGGFERTAAQTVAGASLASLSVLTDRALIQRMPDTTGGSRYHMHELVHDYAVQRLSDLEARAVDELRARHFDYYLGLVERADAAWETDDEQQALVALEPDPANIDIALSWAIEAGDTDRALRMAAGLFAFWVYAATLERNAVLLTRVLELPWKPSSAAAITNRARALNVAGFAALNALDVDLAGHRFQESRALSEQVDAPVSTATSLRGLGATSRLSGDLAAAQTYVERGLALSRAAGDERGVAWSRYDLGGIARSRGTVDEALALFEESVGSFGRLGMTMGAYWAHAQLGELHLRRGELELCLDCFGQALAIQERRHLAGHGAELLEGVAGVAERMRRFELAATLRGAGQSWRNAFGHRHLNAHGHSHPPAVSAGSRQLGQEALHEAFEAGQRLPFDQSQALLRTAVTELTTSLSGSLAGLTSREVEVLQLVALGLSNADISERLVVSPRTVHAHLRSIFDKLGVTTRTAAAHEAVRIGVA